MPDGDDWLRGGERDVLTGLSVPKRRADWRRGRWAAKVAVGVRLGVPRGLLEALEFCRRQHPSVADVWTAQESSEIRVRFPGSDKVYTYRYCVQDAEIIEFPSRVAAGERQGA